MDFGFSEPQQMFKDTIRDFAAREIAPIREEAERTSTFPVHLFPQMGKRGYLCVEYPPAYGGAGLGKIGDCIFCEEVSYVSYGICGCLMVNGGIGTLAILRFGSEEQKQKYVVPAVKGDKISAFALTEPNAGSDSAAIETTAVRKGGHYILNGTKTFITNGTLCDFVCVAAYTDRSKGTRGGVSLFVVDRGTPGLHSSKLHTFCAHSGNVAELTLEDCAVPEENLIGKEGEAFPYLMQTLEGGRIGHAARSLGLARAAYDTALGYARERRQFGQPIAKFQTISFKLARMAVDLEAARWLIYYAAWLRDQNAPHTKEASMAKLFASEVATSVTTECMQIHGGYGVLEGSAAQRHFRNARLGPITEGTSEIHLLIISRQIGIR